MGDLLGIEEDENVERQVLILAALDDYETKPVSGDALVRQILTQMEEKRTFNIKEINNLEKSNKSTNDFNVSVVSNKRSSCSDEGLETEACSLPLLEIEEICGDDPKPNVSSTICHAGWQWPRVNVQMEQNATAQNADGGLRKTTNSMLKAMPNSPIVRATDKIASKKMQGTENHDDLNVVYSALLLPKPIAADTKCSGKDLMIDSAREILQQISNRNDILAFGCRFSDLDAIFGMCGYEFTDEELKAEILDALIRQQKEASQMCYVTGDDKAKEPQTFVDQGRLEEPQIIEWQCMANTEELRAFCQKLQDFNVVLQERVDSWAQVAKEQQKELEESVRQKAKFLNIIRDFEATNKSLVDVRETSQRARAVLEGVMTEASTKDQEECIYV